MHRRNVVQLLFGAKKCKMIDRGVGDFTFTQLLGNESLPIFQSFIVFFFLLSVLNAFIVFGFNLVNPSFLENSGLVC